MLILIILWLFTFLAGLGVGTVVLYFTSSKEPTTEPLKNFLVGLAVITALASYWSIRLPVTPLLYLIIVPVTGYGLVLHWRSSNRNRWTVNNGALIAGLTVAALCLSLTDTHNIDEAGYYLPLVKWIESYPVVTGTALLNHRIGFNSGFHMLNAVFGLERWIEGGVYKLNGLLFIVFNFYFFQRLVKIYKSNKVSLPDLLLIISLVFQFSFLLDSMDSDYIGIMGAIAVMAWSLEALETRPTPRELVAIILVALFLFTIRPFNAFLLAVPAWIILSQKVHRKKVLLYALAGGLLVLPWFIRNYYLSGYLIFPLHFLDIFNPEWKVPKTVALASHDVISEFAKLEIVRPEYLYDSMTYPSLQEWWPVWLQRNWAMLIGKVVILLAPLSVLVFAVSAFRPKLRQIQNAHYFFLLYTIPILSIWFFNYPSIRFGWPWLLLLFSGAGIILLQLSKIPSKYFALVLAVIIALSWLRLMIKLNYSSLTEHPLKPIPVKTRHHLTELKKGTLVLKYSSDAHCYGVEPPCLPYNNPLDIIPRGTTIEEGFKVK